MINPIVTDRDIRALRDEAAEAGNEAQIQLCDRALGGDQRARARCERVIFDVRMANECAGTENTQ